MKVVFLDRDGIINKYPGDGDYVKSIKEFKTIPGVFKALKRLKEQGYKLFIISNQACVGRGVITQEKLNQITDKLEQAALKQGLSLDGIFYCTHHPDDKCPCRKPNIGNIKKAMASIKSHPSKIKIGFFIGDTDKDIETGHKAKLNTILVESGRDREDDFINNKLKPHYVTKHLSQAVDLILEYENTCHSRNSRRRS